MACLAFGDDLFGENGASDSCDLVSADGGESFSVGVTQAGDIVGWGSSFHGELGHDEGEQPQRIRSLPVTIHVPTKCLLVACGLHHVLALDVNGSVYAWGRNAHGEIAQPPSKTAQCPRPTRVAFFTMEATTRFVALAAGGGHSLALQSNGIVWSWGENMYGQLGMGTTSEDESTPHSITFPHQLPVKSIAAGYAHSAALAQDGSVFTFGWGLYHQLGHGATENCPLPTRVDALDGIDHGMHEVACGTWHTAAVSSQGDVYTWGWGPDGQLGPSQGTSAAVPSVVDTVDDYFAQEDEGHHAWRVACGARCTLVVSRAGDLFCWGRNGPSIMSSAAARLKSRSKAVTAVAAGHSHVLVLVEASGKPNETSNKEKKWMEFQT